MHPGFHCGADDGAENKERVTAIKLATVQSAPNLSAFGRSNGVCRCVLLVSEGHDHLSVSSRSTRPIMPEILRQFSVSISSCFCPLFVME